MQPERPRRGPLRLPEHHIKDNTNVDINTYVMHDISPMNAGELRRWLRRQGCTFHTHRGGSGHVTVRLGDRTSQLAMHSGRKELGRGLVAKIKKDLGLD